MNCEPCRYFRNKKMFIPTQADSALELDPAEPVVTQCWCNRTLSELGHDERLATLTACSDPRRGCFQAQ